MSMKAFCGTASRLVLSMCSIVYIWKFSTAVPLENTAKHLCFVSKNYLFALYRAATVILILQLNCSRATELSHVKFSCWRNYV